MTSNPSITIGAGAKAAPRSRTAVPALLAALLGVVLVWGVGFSHAEAFHNAAHDTRHSNAFPAIEAWEMAAFRSFFLVAALAGLIAGAFITIVHQFGTVPIILHAEVFEKAGEEAAAAPAASTAAPAMSAAAPAPAAAAEHDHEHGAAAWEPQDGFERTAYTLLADVLTGIGFALLLVAAYAVHGGEVDWRRGLFWGLAGFATFTLAPGLGLPPEVPGTEAAPLFDRQVWWVATALATGGGLALIFLTRSALWTLAGIVLLVLPHAYGAPQPAEYRSVAPESLAHDFIVAAVITSLLFWAVLGSLTGLLYQRFRPAA